MIHIIDSSRVDNSPRFKGTPAQYGLGERQFNMSSLVAVRHPDGNYEIVRIRAGTETGKRVNQDDLNRLVRQQFPAPIPEQKNGTCKTVPPHLCRVLVRATLGDPMRDEGEKPPTHIGYFSHSQCVWEVYLEAENTVKPKNVFSWAFPSDVRFAEWGALEACDTQTSHVAPHPKVIEPDSARWHLNRLGAAARGIVYSKTSLVSCLATEDLKNAVKAYEKWLNTIEDAP